MAKWVRFDRSTHLTCFLAGWVDVLNPPTRFDQSHLTHQFDWLMAGQDGMTHWANKFFPFFNALIFLFF